jgi:predicted phosphodiesterase
MRVAIVSDVHGNRHAFEAVLDAVEAAGAEELWCLGDLVGYGAEHDACVELARRHAAVCLVGNHDLAVLGQIPFDQFTRGAELAARWTQETIDPASRAAAA